MYLYSMEIGSPQLYAEVNRVARDQDKTYLKELGPFLKALGRVTWSAESSKLKSDKVASGENLGGEVFNLAGSFILFRGAPMRDEWLKPYADKIGMEIKLP